MKPIQSETHSFNVSLALQYGVDEAILISHFSFWINFNKRKGKNLHDGQTWMYQTRKDIAANYPYWTEKQLIRITKSLIKQGVIITRNDLDIAKPLWYAFADSKENNDAQTGNDVAQTGNGLHIAHTYSDKDTKDSMSVLPSSVEPEAAEMRDELRKAQEADEKSHATASESVDSPATTPPTPAAPVGAPSLKSILIKDTNGNSTMISESDLFLRSSQKRFKGTADELKEAWVALQSKKGPVSDWWAFIEAVVKNKRNEKKGAAYGAKNALGAGKSAKSKSAPATQKIVTEEEKEARQKLLKKREEDAKKIDWDSGVPIVER